MQIKLFLIISLNRAVGKLFVVHHSGDISASRSRWNLKSAFQLENVNIVQIVVVFSIEASKNYHTTAYKAS